jgi:hypothetical protein
MAVACGMFCGKVFASLGFSHRMEFIGGRAMLGVGPGAHTTWWHGQGVAHATLGCGRPLDPSVSPLDSISDEVQPRQCPCFRAFET